MLGAWVRIIETFQSERGAALVEWGGFSWF